MSAETPSLEGLQAQLAKLSPERRALVERVMRARAQKEAGIARRVDPAQAPLSAMQRFLWLLTEATPGLFAYNAPRAFRLTGDLDVNALRNALDGLVARHEIFRTRIVPVGDDAIQRIDPPRAVALSVHDLSGADPAAVQRQVDELLGERSRVPFNLAADLLLRADLVRLDDTHHVLLLVSHHFASDGWSRNVMFRELAELYAAAHRGRKSALAPVAIQYGDYAAWQDARNHSGALDADLTYWRRQLEGAPAMLDLPVDKVRPVAPGFGGIRRGTVIAAEIATVLERRATENGASLFMLLLAAHAVLLRRYTGQAELVIGIPVAGRSHPDLEGVIGYLGNTLPIRISLADDPSFSDLVARVRAACLEAFEHQELPFEELALEVQRSRPGSHAPVFQSLFTLHDQNPVEMSLDGVVVEPLGFETGWTKLDLVFDAGRRPDGALQVMMSARADLFESATIERMLTHVTTLLAAIAEDPSQRVSELRLLPELERQRVVEEWNRTSAVVPGAETLHAAIADQARRTPAAIALEWEESDGRIARMTFGDLLLRSEELAGRLRALGAGAGVGIGVCAERSPALVIGMLGTMLAGSHYVPFDPSYPADRLAFMVEDAAVPIMLVHAATRDAARAFMDLASSSARVIDLDAETVEIPLSSASPAVAPDDLAYIIYTSGSTGRPKGVMIPHRAVVNYLRWMGSAYPMDAGDAVLQKAPASFDACIWEFFLPLVTGARMVLARPGGHQDPEYLLASLARHGVTILQLVPVQLRMMFELSGAGAGVATAFTRLRHLFFGGEALPGELLTELRRVAPVLRVANLYGPTEATVYATSWDVPPGPWTSINVPIGRPIINASVYVVDSSMRPVPIGVRGELCIGGVGLARGYLNRTELTAEKFVPDPFRADPAARLYRTGDLARWTADGVLQYAGRIDEQVKVRGHRIELGEVEAVLAASDLVSQAVVVMRTAPSGAQLVAYFVPAESAQDQPVAALRTALFDEMRRTLPAYMVPSFLVAMDAIPISPNGKVSRKDLPEPDNAAIDETEYVAPRTVLEATIVEVWAEVLGRDRVGVNDNFFALGGHSLLAMRVIARLADRLSARPAMSQLFEAPTVAKLAAVLAPMAADGTTSLPHAAAIPRRVDRSHAPLTPVQQRFWIGEQLESGHAGFNVHVAMRLHEIPGVTRLEAAVHDLHARHEALRAAIVGTGEMARQQIADVVEPAFVVTDCRRDPAETLPARMRAITNAERAHEFDLARAPLARFHLVLLPGEAILHVVLHHLISDGWAVRVILADLAALYRGDAGPIPVDAPDYGDYAEWLATPDQKTELERHVGFWREHLAGAPQLLELPTDRPRSANRAARSARTTSWISPDVVARVRATANAEGATLFMALMAAFHSLLSRLSGQDDVVVGVPVTGRTTPDEERIVGCFINTIPLRLSLAGTPSFREMIGRARTAALGGLEHQTVPFDRMVRELAPERSLSHTPLFQVLFNMMNFPASQAPSLGTLLEMRDDAAVTSKFDLTLYVSDRDADGIRLVMAYDAGLFDESRIGEMLRQFAQLLDLATRTIDAPVTSYSLVTPEAAALLPDPALSLADTWHGAVHELVARRAELDPARIAIADANGEWSYAALDDAAGRIAGALRAAGVSEGDVVGVYGDRSTALVVALVGVLRSGAAFMVLDAAYPVPRLAEYVRQARPAALLRLTSAGGLPQELGAAVNVLEIPATVAAFRASAIGAASPQAGARVGADDLAYVAFTSGTSGVPKGIRGRHGSLTHFTPWRSMEFRLGADDRFSMLSGLSHDPLHRDVFVPLQLGATICVPPAEAMLDGVRLCAWLRESGVTVAHLTPGMTQLLGSADASLPALRWAFFVGDALQWTDVARLRRTAQRVRMVNQYGATETQQALGFHELALPDLGPVERPEGEFEVLPAGRGVPDAQLLVLSGADGLAGVGELGEVAIRSPHISLGYLDPALEGGRFAVNPATGDAADRWYRTGDLGRFLPDGSVVLAGRADDQVKIRGFRVEPAEIAAALRAEPGVADALVLHHNPHGGGPELIGFVVAPELSHPDLRRALRARLPEYMVPAAFVSVDTIPLTPNGKVDRRALLALATSATLETAEPEPPANAIEDALLTLWRSTLKRARIGVTDSFFDLGGHSLLATQLVARVGQVFRCTVPLRVLFEKPRIRDFAVELVARETRPGLTEQIARLVLQVESMPTGDAGRQSTGTTRGSA